MAQVEEKQCCYRGAITGACRGQSLSESSFCFWHDPDVDKSSPDLSVELEERARSNIPMEGFQLKGARLDGLNLVKSDEEGYQLLNSDLRRCSLKGAHLFRLNLSGSNLMKADLNKANLHRANLTGCNLLGINLKASRLEHVNFGNFLHQEQLGFAADKQGESKQAVEWFEEAEEVARNIRKHFEEQGLFHEAGQFFYKEMVLKRYRLPKWSISRFVSKLVNMLSGYGEKPERVIVFSMSFILFCSFFYFLCGIQDQGELVQFRPERSIIENFRNWLDSLYFSVVTFTTLGYGDLTPVGLSRLIAALEAFTGSFTLALFVVVFVKKMTR